jgi:hypothetical protein
MKIDDLCLTCQEIVRRGRKERAQRFRDRRAAIRNAAAKSKARRDVTVKARKRYPSSPSWLAQELPRVQTANNAGRYPFNPGEAYSRDDVVDVIEKRIRSGAYKNPRAASAWLDEIRKCRFETLVWTPFGKSHACSPMNPNAWRTEDGKPIWKPHRIPGG